MINEDLMYINLYKFYVTWESSSEMKDPLPLQKKKERPKDKAELHAVQQAKQTEAITEEC